MHRNIFSCTLSVLTLAIMLGSAGSANAAFTHTGANYPVVEGWSTNAADAYPGSDEMDYWEVNSAAPLAGKANGLTDPVAASIINSPDGWSLEATAKVTVPLAEYNTTLLRVIDNMGDPAAADMSSRGTWGDTWSINLMTDPGGDPSKTGVWTQGLTTGDDPVFVAPVDITTYHTYGMTMTRGATLQEDSVEYTVDGVPVATYARTDTYNMQYWRSYVPDGWSDCSWGRLTAGTGVASVSRWNDIEFKSGGATPETIIHTGINHPVAEGWEMDTDSYPGDDGIEHWETNSASIHYFRADGLADTAAADIIDSPNGWSLNATVKVTEPLAGLNTTMMRVTDNLGDPAAADQSSRGAWGDTWAIQLMTDPGGDQEKTGIWIQTMADEDNAVFLEAVDITEYHDYGMIMTRGATLQEDSVELTLDGVSIATITRAETYNMQYWRSYAPDGWSDCTWGRTTASPAADCVARWNSVEFVEREPADNLPGDANLDGVVNEKDAAILADNWQMAGSASWGQGDFNGDHKVDDIDATILAANWQVASGASASVPEPSSIVLLLGAVALMAFYRRK